ncbi:MAG TPA: DUF327 family protein [bacterium]|jgi:uncharacterized protein YaaR (DUF327 family)
MADFLDKIRKSTANKSAERVSRVPGNPPEIPQAEGVSFESVLSRASRNPTEKRLELIFEDISRLATILSRRRLLEDLEEYREKVSQFLKTYIEEVLDVKEAVSRKGINRRKQLLVVKRVNVELEELSRFVLGDAPDFKVIRELTTIQGLLMDLYR